MKALVVDDDPVVLKSCQRILEAEGVTVSLSWSAADALKQLESGKFDVTLVDVKMPEEDGFSMATRAIKRNGRAAPLILMSGYPTEQTRARSSEVGAMDFIAKPFTPAELVASVRRTTRGCSS